MFLRKFLKLVHLLIHIFFFLGGGGGGLTLFCKLVVGRANGDAAHAPAGLEHLGVDRARVEALDSQPASQSLCVRACLHHIEQFALRVRPVGTVRRPLVDRPGSIRFQVDRTRGGYRGQNGQEGATRAAPRHGNHPIQNGM